MYKTSIFFIILQVLFLGLSTSAHSIDLSHAEHEGVHVHFEDSEHESSTIDEGHESGSHFHFPFVLLLNNSALTHVPSFNNWHSEYLDNALSKTYAPPVPPPNAAS